MQGQGQVARCIDLVRELVRPQALHDAQRGCMVHGAGAQHRQNVLLRCPACMRRVSMIRKAGHL